MKNNISQVRGSQEMFNTKILRKQRHAIKKKLFHFISAEALNKSMRKRKYSIGTWKLLMPRFYGETSTRVTSCSRLYS